MQFITELIELTFIVHIVSLQLIFSNSMYSTDNLILHSQTRNKRSWKWNTNFVKLNYEQGQIIEVDLTVTASVVVRQIPDG